MRRWTALTYIEYLNGFTRWIETDSPTDKVIILYYGLLSTFNHRRWPRWTGVDTQRLMMLARTSDKKTALRARDALVRAGFIEYKRGKRGKVTEYHLLEYSGKSLPENSTENATISATQDATPNKNKTETKKKTFSSGGDGGAAPAPAPVSEAAAAVGECLLERDIDKSLYFGMTDAVQGEAAQIAEELFSKFGWGTPGAVDISKVFDYTCHREGVRDETQITFHKERVKLLTYAFEQAAKKGEPRNWNYIDGVMRKLARRGIDTVEKAEDYDYEREARA